MLLHYLKCFCVLFVDEADRLRLQSTAGVIQSGSFTDRSPHRTITVPSVLSNEQLSDCHMV